MLKRIWQWLKGLFGRLFETPQSSTPSSLSTGEAPPPLADSDYEYLFRQLLEGITHGWQQDRVVRWFEAMKGRTPLSEWAAWLRRFGERVLASPALNNELATRLVQLGEKTTTVPSLREIGEVAYSIGTQLLDRNPKEPIWEFDGLDAPGVYEGEDAPLDAEGNAPPLVPSYEGEQIESQEVAATETITLDELLERLQEDQGLVQLLAQQIGIETNDPHVIIEAVINQFNAANEAAASEAEVLFAQGVQQDEAGDYEGAITSYDKALEIQPNLYEAWFNRGNVLSKIARLEEAVYSYDKVIEIKPDIHEVWHNRGNALFNLGRWEESNASYEKAREIQAQ
ncbi:MAG TPA: tetratricopeptide repeat protein [Candidatus Sericytochromatia bacterium]|jgi:tetratricopeptide (TPR) repeat protein